MITFGLVSGMSECASTGTKCEEPLARVFGSRVGSTGARDSVVPRCQRRYVARASDLGPGIADYSEAGIDADDHPLVSAQAVAALGQCVITTAQTGALPETGPDPAVTASGHAPAC